MIFKKNVLLKKIELFPLFKGPGRAPYVPIRAQMGPYGPGPGP